jgi:5'-nucleotidase
MHNHTALLGLLFVSTFGQSWAQPVHAQSTSITIAHLADTHSWLDAYGPKGRDLRPHFGGIARAATVLDDLRSRSPNLLVLHAGDFMHGTEFFNAYFGVPELQILQGLGVDAMALGNHEFDFGPDFLTSVLSQLDGLFPVLGANLDLSGYPALTSWIQPSIIRQIGGLNVGIFGMTTPDDPAFQPAPVVIRGRSDAAALRAIAVEQVSALRNAGADIVVLLSHLGAARDAQLGAEIDGLDVIVGGHTHAPTRQAELIPHPARGQTILVRAGAAYSGVGVLSLRVDAGMVALESFEVIELDSTVARDPSVQAAVDQLKRGVEARYGNIYDRAIGYAVREMSVERESGVQRRDSQLGDLVTDAYRAHTGTQLAVSPAGLIGGPLPAGYLTAADAFRVASYGYDPGTGLGFKLATFDITGAELLKALEVGLAAGGDLFLEVSGLRFRYDSSAPDYAKIDAASLRVVGEAWNAQSVYSVTVNEGSARALDLFGVQVSNLQLLADLEYDVLADYIECQRVVHPIGAPRIWDAAERP